ncbi:glycoside hydrolase family 127 protein [Deinococcus peraridilitoris]|uniref:Glycoside hydrolase family 127 protein n=1 Tax=Deinococcus peraridilitoris (strain DSM 19664 / LMG 22246 / CIP 109416 / KR-200) TaxID=937777 RepID=K9ZXF6_DEIPD|nr:beta-L-arabinofuranosidase domain-containing protein [Deinococcus peraridilitoris]AFZ66343.1 hypothetical protein Deipe_0766 [Deinococcus peraridilitoris DSM 19664]
MTKTHGHQPDHGNQTRDSATSGAPLTPPHAVIADPFWERYTELVRTTVIPYQWEALNDRVEGAEPSHAVRNFRIAAGLEDGSFHGFVFQDSDLAKWLEAVGHSLAQHPDPELERTADAAIDLIAAAQHPSGYLNTYFTIQEPGQQWTNLLDCHELYCAGHLIEAAVAYHRATGKRVLLDVVIRLVDHIDEVFGPREGQLRGYDGHQEIELALVKLFEATGERRYLELSRFFIDERGRAPNFLREEWERRGRVSHFVGKMAALDLSYNQAHVPVREQNVAVGHAVRAVYMYTAMADLARLTGDASLHDACRVLWSNMTGRQMYITGAIGATHHGEAFTFDYDLPNDTVYAETCASIGLIFFARRMLQLEPRGEYADVMERALYNTVLGSMSMDGRHYFYVNPLEVWPAASAGNPGRRHVKATRQPWFGCSCCPPNVARLLSSLGEYLYQVSDDDRTVYAHLFVGSIVTLSVAGHDVTLRQESSLPWSGRATFTIGSLAAREPRGQHGPGEAAFQLALRVPAWRAGEPQLRVNGEDAAYNVNDGYALVDRAWREGDTVEWILPMAAQLMTAHPNVRANAGRVAIQRGPLVYCLEEIDNGGPLASLVLPADATLEERVSDILLPGMVMLDGRAMREETFDSLGETNRGEAGTLYRPFMPAFTEVPVRAVPYFLWGNRELGEMNVWLRTHAGL